jgi:type II secretory pathway component PulF
MIWLISILSVIGAAAYGMFVWKKPGWGLVTMPLIVAILILVSMADENIVILCAALSIIPVVIALVRWAPCASPLETPWHKTFAIIVLTLFQYLVLLAALTLIFNVLGPLLFVLIVVGVVRSKRTLRYSMAMDILSAIGMSMRQSLPLPMALTAAAECQNRRQARIFRDITSCLVQGLPLSESLRRGYPKCPPELVASIAAAEQMNQLPRIIETLQSDIAEKVNDYNRVRPVHPWYPLLVFVVAFFVVVGLAVFIVPTFSEVLSDMSDGKTQLPASTQYLLEFARYLMGRKGLNAFFITVPMAAVIIYVFTRGFRRRKPQQPGLLSRLEDWLKWHLPVLHWFERTYSQLQLTELLIVGLNAGYPVNITLRNARSLDVNHCLRKLIETWLAQIEQGEKIAIAAHKAGFDKPLAWAFDDSVNKGNTPLILESIEEVYRSRYSYRLNILNSVGCPLMVLSIGLIIGWVVYALFMGAFSILFLTIQNVMP